MTKKSKRNNKPIFTVCAVVVAVVLLVVVAVLLLSNKRIDDNFFASDGSKYVYTMDYGEDMLGLDLGEYTPKTIHMIYFYSANKVTDLKYYYVYEDEAIAKEAAEYIRKSNEGNFKDITLNGKYVIITAEKSSYEEMTAEDAKNQIEFREEMRRATSGEEVEEETNEEEAEEEPEEIVEEAEEEPEEEFSEEETE